MASVRRDRCEALLFTVPGSFVGRPSTGHTTKPCKLIPNQIWSLNSKQKRHSQTFSSSVSMFFLKKFDHAFSQKNIMMISTCLYDTRPFAPTVCRPVGLPPAPQAAHGQHSKPSQRLSSNLRRLSTLLPMLAAYAIYIYIYYLPPQTYLFELARHIVKMCTVVGEDQLL